MRLTIRSNDDLTEYYRQLMIYGSCQTDEDGVPVPREVPEHWHALGNALRGQSVTGYLPSGVQVSGHRAGKRTMIKAILEGAGTSTPPDNGGFTLHGVPEYQPQPLKVIADVAPEDVRWSCKRPTTPIYAVGTYGWAMEQAAARISPAEREYNRKLNAESAAMMASFAEMLGIKKP